jgi:hypothetical protein
VPEPIGGSLRRRRLALRPGTWHGDHAGNEAACKRQRHPNLLMECHCKPGPCSCKLPQIKLAAHPNTPNNEPLPFKIRRRPAQIFHESPIVQ